MIYGLFRWFTGIALHWFYSSIKVVGRERIPLAGPVLLATNHPNALVDALIAGWIIPRRLTITAKATLIENPILAKLFATVGVVPLRRTSDERNRGTGSRTDTSRNVDAFRSILKVLSDGQIVLIFPEGVTHNEPGLAPLKTGISRIALDARDSQGIQGLRIVPLGLSFEDKGNPGTAVLAEIGEPIVMDELGTISVQRLTSMLSERLAAVSLKYPAPSLDRSAIRKGTVSRPLISPIAAWGELTHRYIINMARDLALWRSKSPEDPAMLTIVFGLILILISYAVQFAIVTALLNPWWAALYVATLPIGAYWAAFKNHRYTIG